MKELTIDANDMADLFTAETAEVLIDVFLGRFNYDFFTSVFDTLLTHDQHLAINQAVEFLKTGEGSAHEDFKKLVKDLIPDSRDAIIAVHESECGACGNCDEAIDVSWPFCPYCGQLLGNSVSKSQLIVENIHSAVEELQSRGGLTASEIYASVRGLIGKIAEDNGITISTGPRCPVCYSNHLFRDFVTTSNMDVDSGKWVHGNTRTDYRCRNCEHGWTNNHTEKHWEEE